jgi:hypothetical protein
MEIGNAPITFFWKTITHYFLKKFWYIIYITIYYLNNDIKI